jgi:hypothetical protein
MKLCVFLAAWFATGHAPPLSKSDRWQLEFILELHHNYQLSVDRVLVLEKLKEMPELTQRCEDFIQIEKTRQQDAISVRNQVIRRFCYYFLEFR